MAIPFLNNLNISDNQLLNAKVQVASTAPTAAKGQIYLDSTTNVNTLKYHDGSQWIGLKQLNLNNSAFINLTNLSATGSNVISLEASLNASGLPSSSNYLRGDNTWAALPGPSTITLTGDVTGSGTTSIATTIASGAVEFAMMDPAAIITSSEGVGNNDNNVTLPTTAAVKAYVDASVAGGLIYQGGYNAATNTPNLDSPPTGTIKRGFTWTVTADGTFFTEQVRTGDVLIAEIDTPTTLADWTTVQSNIDLASLTQVGIGNVNAGTGIDVAYSSGTATVTNTDRGSSQNIFKNIAVLGQSTVVAESNDDTLTLVAGTDISIATDSATDTITISSIYAPPVVSYAVTISATATITHSLGTRDVMVQLYDTVTYETVYADVARPSTNTVTITFAATPANPIRVLVQK